nr:MAG TPA: hypothetical protein [Caudoviricetes sp.]DAN25156.1 MAG TPA: hypothetical protein [Caudoviricetes sp.]
MCYVDIILYCIWGCDLVCCCASRWFYFVQIFVLLKCVTIFVLHLCIIL